MSSTASVCREAFECSIRASSCRSKVVLDPRADRIKQDRFFDNLPREHLLGETRHEYGVEAETSRYVDRADENLSVSLHRRRHCGLEEQTSKDDEDFAQLNRTHRSNGGQLREDHEHAVGPLERPGRQPPERLKPLAPARLRRQVVEFVYEWEDVAGEGGEIVQRSFECLSLCLVLFAELREVATQFVREAIDRRRQRSRRRSPRPPRAGVPNAAVPLVARHGRIHQVRRCVRCCGCGDARVLRCKRRDRLGVRRDPRSSRDLASGAHHRPRRPAPDRARDLGELPRREPFGGAFE